MVVPTGIIRAPRSSWSLAISVVLPLAGGCRSGARMESADGSVEPSPSVEGEAPIECKRPAVHVHVDVMNCRLLEEREVAERLQEVVAPRLVEIFDTAPVTNPCDGSCGIELDLEVETVTWCRQEVARQTFVDGLLLPEHVAAVRVREPSVRHVVWGVDFKTEDGRRPSGYARHRDAIVAIGGVYRRGDLPPRHLAETEAATLMHELGHTLGLTHGDPACTEAALQSRRCARLPHHLSVMNYGWLARGVGFGAGVKEPEAWTPTYQGFRTRPLRERQGTVVEIDRSSPQCPVGELPETAHQPWVAFYPEGTDHPPRRVPMATPLRVDEVADGTGVDLNGDGHTGERYRGQPNEWEWIVAHQGSMLFHAISEGLFEDLKRLRRPLAGLDPEPPPSPTMEELSVDALVADLESSIVEP